MRDITLGGLALMLKACRYTLDEADEILESRKENGGPIRIDAGRREEAWSTVFTLVSVRVFADIEEVLNERWGQEVPDGQLAIDEDPTRRVMAPVLSRDQWGALMAAMTVYLNPSTMGARIIRDIRTTRPHLDEVQVNSLAKGVYRETVPLGEEIVRDVAEHLGGFSKDAGDRATEWFIPGDEPDGLEALNPADLPSA